jgi:hypothetical protein
MAAVNSKTTVRGGYASIAVFAIGAPTRRNTWRRSMSAASTAMRLGGHSSNPFPMG